MKIKPALYRVGQKVTTYQTDNKKCIIVKCEIRWHNEEKTNYNYAYQLELSNGQLSNWTAERSINELTI